MATQSRMKTIDTIKVDNKLTAKVLSDKYLGGRPLGSPINSKNVGEEFDVTLTGEIQIREFEGQKSAYFLTKEGFSVRVNASFDPSVHKANATMRAICREFPRENGQTVKFCAFAA